MDVKVTKAAETLIKSNTKETDVPRSLKLNSIKTIDEFLPELVVQTLEFPRTLSLSLFALLYILQDADMNVWSLSEQAVVKLVKTYSKNYIEAIISEVWKGVRGLDVTLRLGEDDVRVKMDGRSRRFSLELFSNLVPKLKQPNYQKFRLSLVKTLIGIIQLNEDQLLQESLSKNINSIAYHLLSQMTLYQLDELIHVLCINISSIHSRVRRSAVICIISVIENHSDKEALFLTIYHRIMNLVMLSSEEISSIAITPDSLKQPIEESVMNDISDIVNNSIPTTLQGVLHAFRQLLRCSLNVHQNEKFFSKNTLGDRIMDILKVSKASIKPTMDPNTIVTSLECIDDVLNLYWLNIMAHFGHQGYEEWIESLLKQLDHILFESNTRVSSQALAISCLSTLAKKMNYPKIVEYLKTRLDNILLFSQNSDPLLRGETYYFIGSFVSGLLASNRTDEYNITDLLTKMLSIVLDEEATITSKMACEGLSVAIQSIMLSPNHHFIIQIIQHLLTLPRTAYPLLKSKVFDLFSKVDFRTLTFIEERMKHVVTDQVLPRKIKSLNHSMQSKSIDFIISYFDDNDNKLRKKACKVLVKMIPNLYYPHYMKNTETSTLNESLNVLELRYDGEMKNPHLKETIDYILWRLVHRMGDGPYFLKGLYHFCRILMEHGYQLPNHFIGLILEQISTVNIEIDLDTHVDIIILISSMASYYKEEYEIFKEKSLIHILKVMNILYQVTSGVLTPMKKGKYDRSALKGTITDEPNYLHLWEKLSDTYRLSLASLGLSIFDEICSHVIASLERIAKSLSTKVCFYIEEILLYASGLFEMYTSETMNLLNTLIYASGSQFKNIHKQFDILVHKCIELHSISQSMLVRRNILNLMFTLLNRGVYYRTIDKDLIFLKQILHQLIKAQQMKTTYDLDDERGSTERSGSSFDRSDSDRSFDQSRLSMDRLRSSRDASRSSLDPFTSSMSSSTPQYHMSGELAAPQLRILLELHMKQKVPIRSFPSSSIDFPLLVDFTFQNSWDPAENLDAFKYIIDTLFDPSIQPPEDIDSQEKPSSISIVDYESILIVRVRIVSHLVDRLPHPRAVNLLLQVIHRMDYNFAFKVEHLSRMIEGLFHMLSDPLKRNETQKMNIKEVHQLFQLMNVLPTISDDLSRVLQVLEISKTSYSLAQAIIDLKLMSTMTPEHHNQDLFPLIYNLLHQGIYSFVKKLPYITSEKKQEEIYLLNGLIDLTLSLIYSIPEPDPLKRYLKTQFESNEILLIESLFELNDVGSILKFCDLSLAIESKSLIKRIVLKSLKDNHWYQEILQDVSMKHWIDLIHEEPDSVLEEFKTAESKGIDSPINTFVEMIIEHAQHPNVHRLLQNMNDSGYAIFHDFVENKMARHEQLRTRDVHQMLLIMSYFRTSKERLGFIMKTFMSSKYISVVIACEKYVLRHADIFDISNQYSVSGDTIVELVQELEPLLSQRFVKKVCELFWVSSQNKPKEEISPSKFLHIHDVISQLCHQSFASHKEELIAKTTFILEKWFEAQETIPLKLEILHRDDALRLYNARSVSEGQKSLEESTEVLDESRALNLEDYHLQEVKSWRSSIEVIHVVSLCMTRFDCWCKQNNRSGWNKAGALSALGVLILEQLFYLYDHQADSISTIDMNYILNYFKLYFSTFEVHKEVLFSDPYMKRFVFGLYNIYFIIFDNGTKTMLNRDSPKDLDTAFKFLVHLLRFKPWTEHISELIEMSTTKLLFYSTLEALAKCSPSMEQEIYEFQDDPINFDFNNEPCDLLDRFNMLINTIPPTYPETFVRVWNQIYKGLDPKADIHRDSTSEKIKMLSVRALTSLLLRTGFQLIRVEKTGPRDPLTLLPVGSIHTYAKNTVYVWRGVNLSLMLEEFIDIVKPHIDKYIQYTTVDVSLGKECLKSLAYLADLFVQNQRTSTLKTLYQAINTHSEVIGDDPLMKGYLLLGFGKLLVLSYSQVAKPSDLIGDYTQKLIKLIHYSISQQSLRTNEPQASDKAMMPISKSLLLYTLTYIAQDRHVVNIRLEPVTYMYLKKSLNQKMNTYFPEIKNSLMLAIERASKNPSALIKHLALMALKSAEKAKP